MTTGKSKDALANHRHLLLILVFIVLTYLMEELLDAFLEGEDLYEQLLSPPRLLSVLILTLFAAYVLKLVIQRTRLRSSLLLNQAAMESSIDGIAIFDAEYRLVYANQAHIRLYGYEKLEDMLGQTWRFFYSEDQVQRFYEEVSPALLERGEWRGETLGTRKDGSRFLQEVSLTRLANGGVIRIVRDNTEKKSYEVELECKARELATTNKALETFSYTLSHDMRSYITRVSSAAQLLQDKYQSALDEDGGYLLGSIQRTSEEMEQLVESIQLLSRISQTRMELEVVNLSEMASTIAANLQLNEPERKMTVLIQPDLYAWCDASLTRVALDNLLGNAWKYTGRAPSPLIEFGAERSGPRELFFVRDNGVGFEMAEANKLFEPFLRLQTAREFPGTGIGLATVQRVIQLHKGELWGVGEPGQGATFYFTLARQAAAS